MHIRITADLSKETSRARRAGKTYFKFRKTTATNPGFYTLGYRNNIRCRNKSISDKSRLKAFMVAKQALSGTLLEEVHQW